MNHHAICRGAVAAVLLAASAASQAAGELRITPYLWYAGFEGTVGTGDPSAPGDEVDADFGHLWDNMRLGGAMLNMSWRDDRWTVFGDWTYAKVKSDTPTQVPDLYSNVTAEVRGNILQAYGGYDVIDRDDAHLDLFAGARYYDIDITLGLESATLADRSLGGDAQWTDAVIGARGVKDFAGNWQAYLLGDIGTGGSDFSCQLIATVGYQFSWGTLVGGWRYLKTNYEDGTYKFDATLTGPFLGASFGF